MYFTTIISYSITLYSYIDMEISRLQSMCILNKDQQPWASWVPLCYRLYGLTCGVLKMMRKPLYNEYNLL